jgi:NAD(P)H-hydrate epimerase
MKLVTSDQMRAIDRDAIEHRGIPSLTLMENAGRGIAERILRLHLSTPASAHVAIFCGKGNNGGDGFVVARQLHQAGVTVDVWFIGPVEQLSHDAHTNLEAASKCGVRLHQVLSSSDIPTSVDCDLIVDAIFGTGFSGTPNEIASLLIDRINKSEVQTIAIDIPSGLNATDGTHQGVAVRAHYTFTLALPKYGLYESPGRELAGRVEILPIGIPEESVASAGGSCELTLPKHVAEKIPRRKPDGHKGDFGRVLAIAGSTGMTGAAVLAAESALRMGCGLSAVACPESVQPVAASLLREVISHPLPDIGKRGALALRGLGEILELQKKYDSLIIGPGLGRHHETLELVRRLVSRIDKPTVLDADGLNAFVDHSDLLADKPFPLVITPHAGEFERLTGNAVPTEIHARIKTAREMAKLLKLTLVLKGSPTIVASPDGQTFLNPTGNPGMATAGSGDVLSGIIGSLLAQGMSGIDAAVCGVFIHGKAGDLAKSELGERGMIAGDMVSFLPRAIRDFARADR